MSNQCDFNECHKILTETRANTLIINRNLDAKSNIFLWIQKYSYEEYKSFRDNGLNLEAQFPIKEVPIGVNLDSSTTKEDYEKLQTYINEGQIREFSNSEAMQIISSVLPEDISKNWLSCMNKMADCIITMGYGLHHEIVRNESEIIVKLQYRPYNPDDPWPVVVEDIYMPSGVTCGHDCLKKGETINREVTAIFNRESGKTGTIVINTDKGSILVPIVPKIDGNSNINIQTEIKKFVQEILIVRGAKFDEVKIPAAPKEHEMYYHFENATVEIENFIATGTVLKCRVVMKRPINVYSYTYHTTKSLSTGEEKEWWDEDVNKSSIECEINIDIDFSSLDLENVIFCATPQKTLQTVLKINECCIFGKELANKIIGWLN